MLWRSGRRTLRLAAALCSAKSPGSNRGPRTHAPLSTHGSSFVFRRLSYLVDGSIRLCLGAAYGYFVVCRVRACFFTTGLRSRIVCGLAKNDGPRRGKGDVYRIVFFSVIVGTFFASFLFFSPCFLQRSRIILPVLL